MKRPRHTQVDVCGECGLCNGKLCEPARAEMREYDGIRFTSDGFDCALPVTIDSHSHCSYACRYCFSDNLISHQAQTSKGIGQTSLSRIESIFSGKQSVFGDNYRLALKYDKRVNGFPCPVQLGGICDPCDHIERQQGWLLDFMELAIKYNQPVRMSTKGTVFQIPEYQRVISKAPHLFWVAFSIISIDDDVMRQVDFKAPVPSDRLKTMEILSKLGVKTSLRFRPIFPGISDTTRKHPKAWKELIDRSADCGAKAISCEVGFYPGSLTVELKRRWEKLSNICGYNLYDIYHSFGPTMSCMRPAYMWTEGIMHAITEEARACGMTVGVSDPVWKQLGDTGCCCGILPDDPVFGNWQRESATNQLLIAKDTGKELFLSDVVPEWAYSVKTAELVNMGVGPKVKYAKKYMTWADMLKDLWNNLEKQRSPLNYFQGALLPVRRDENGDMVYKYSGLVRQYKTVKEWTL